MINKSLTVVLWSSLICGGLPAFAHGGGGMESDEEVKPKAVSRRLVAKAPRVLSESELNAIAGKEIPQDVVSIHCKLSEFTNCRGLIISLSDVHGKEVASSGTGMNGIVAFEGLKHKATYFAKIESEKYLGGGSVVGGGSWSIYGSRMTETASNQ